jgi:16S rRNA (cytidine1402-2'-O)-methyltransferase
MLARAAPLLRGNLREVSARENDPRPDRSPRDATEPPPSPARLTLVPTPIGHLDDVTLRALATLRHADVVAAEDTRRTRILLDHHGIATPLVRLDAHTTDARAEAILRAHHHVAYVTDAGTPGISDPGASLLRLALHLGHHVESLPGPTALIPALVLSALPLHRFAFEGFLPRSGRERRERLAAIAASERTTALYEAANRLTATLGDLIAACGADRSAAVARELTKRFEEVRRGSLADLLTEQQRQPARGEVVVIVAAAPRTANDPAAADAAADADDLARRLARQGLWGRELRTALEAAGITRRDAFALAVRHGRASTG